MCALYVDSTVSVNAVMYEQIVRLMGQPPDGWGRYFYSPVESGQGNGFYDPSRENSIFHEKGMRLLPIARQEAHIASNNYHTGYNDGMSNLKAVLAALGGDAATFPDINGHHWCAFMLDAESSAGGILLTTFVQYLRGWLAAMGTGVVDAQGHYLYGWGGIYSSQRACGTWATVLDCYHQYGLRPKFVAVASYLTPGGATVPPSPQWDVRHTSTGTAGCVAIGQPTVLWQYAGNVPVGGQEMVDLSAANPHLNFFAELGQFCPIPG